MGSAQLNRHIIFLLLSLVCGVGFSQKKDKDRIQTEEINVVKPFSPTVSEAFKINTEPEITRTF